MKGFADHTFNGEQFSQELRKFKALLDSSETLTESAQLQPLFRECPNLTAYIGTAIGMNLGIARQIAYEFQLMGDFAADIVIGNREKQFCLIELEDGDPQSILTKVGKKATKEWGRRFEHGFSQLVDWFCHLDEFRKTPHFNKNFGYGQIHFVGMLLIGRSQGLDQGQRTLNLV